MRLSRRDWLKSASASAAVLAAGVRPAWAAPQAAAKKIPVGLQLYSVRDQAAKELPRVLAAVAEMGYVGVEFAGYYGHEAKELRKLLDQNGLKCCGSHLSLDVLKGDALKATVEFNQTIGNKYLIVAWMPGMESVEKIRQTAGLFDQIAGAIREQGMRVGYHAHGGDFVKVDGQPAWDIFFSSTGPDVVMQLDIGNCLGGGGDPYATLKRFPGRSATVHLKEEGGPPEAVIGDGVVKWDEVFTLCETIGGTEWYIVEHERAGDSLENVKRCLANIRKMGR